MSAGHRVGCGSACASAVVAAAQLDMVAHVAWPVVLACFAVAAHNRTNCGWPSAIRVRSATNARAAALCLVRIGNEKRRPLSSHVRRLTYHVCGSFMDNKESRFQLFLLVYEPAARRLPRAFRAP